MKTNITIIPFKNTHEELVSLHQIFNDINSEGDSFPFPANTSIETFEQIWCQKESVSFVAVDPESNTICGAYFIKPQWPGRGSHIATATYMVAKSARGNGLGWKLGTHSLEEAFKAGYKGMQFNYVVSTNNSAIKLWKSLGFEIIGTLPGVFQHKSHGEVDAFVMFRNLIKP